MNERTTARRYSRIVSGKVPVEKLDAAIMLWQTFVGPSARLQKSFINARLLVDRSTGRIVWVGLWDNEPDVQATSQWNRDQIARFAGLFVEPPTVEEHFEVVAEA